MSQPRPIERFGRYHLLHRIAVGGMAEIFVAWDSAAPEEQRLVVVKRIREDLCHDQNFVHMFLEEARVISGLSHPNVVSLLDFGHVDGRYYIALEFVWGESLANLLLLCEYRRVQFPVGAALYIGGETARALHYAHRHCGPDGQLSPVIHRDVTLGNVVVSYQGAVKLLDFGIAKAKDRHAQTEIGNIKGTLAYLAPEQVLQQELGPYTDIYQLGVLLYKSLVGCEPVALTNEAAVLTAIVEGRIVPPSQKIPGFPSSVEQIILQAMAREPRDRFASAGDLRTAILDLLGPHYQLGKQGLVSMVRRITGDRFERQRRVVQDLLKGAMASAEQGELLEWAATAREPRQVNVELSALPTVELQALGAVSHDDPTRLAAKPGLRPSSPAPAEEPRPTVVVDTLQLTEGLDARSGEEGAPLEADAATQVGPAPTAVDDEAASPQAGADLEFGDVHTQIDEPPPLEARTRIEEMAFPDVRTLLGDESEHEQEEEEEIDARTAVDSSPLRELREQEERDAKTELSARPPQHRPERKRPGSPSGVFASLESGERPAARAPTSERHDAAAQAPDADAFSAPTDVELGQMTVPDGGPTVVSTSSTPFEQPAGGDATVVSPPAEPHPAAAPAQPSVAVPQPRPRRDDEGFASDGPTLVLDDPPPPAEDDTLHDSSPQNRRWPGADARTISMSPMRRPRRPPPAEAQQRAADAELDFDIDVEQED